MIDEFDQNLLNIPREAIAKIEAANEDLTSIKEGSQEQALYFIARLYAELEWAHPRHDGQGRTDLIMLNGLFARQAFTLVFWMAILLYRSAQY